LEDVIFKLSPTTNNANRQSMTNQNAILVFPCIDFCIDIVPSDGFRGRGCTLFKYLVQWHHLSEFEKKILSQDSLTGQDGHDHPKCNCNIFHADQLLRT